MNRLRLLIFGWLLITGVILLQPSQAAPAIPAAASPGALDTTFDPGAGADDIVFAIALQSNNQVLIGGQFTHVNGATHNCIARLNANGSLDATYNPSVTGTGFVGLTSLALQSDGKVVIGGAFAQVNGTGRVNIARLNDDGTLDTTFDPGAGMTGTFPYLNAVRLQSDGKPIIGGVFTTVGTTARNNIARLTTTGALDTTFDPGTGTNDEVSAIAIQPSDGKVLIGGAFTTVNGAAHHRLARLNTNGSVDSAFNPDIGDGAVLAIAVQSDGKILIGGTFTTVNSTARNRLARLDANGSLDTTFNPNANNDVDAIALQPDGKSVIGGNFITVGGTERVRIARLNTNGTLDTTFDPGAGAVGWTVYAVTLQPDGKVLIGGAFQKVGGVARNRIARLYGDAFVFLPLILR
jgi:uncharacterized delta-60 repeat protein